MTQRFWERERVVATTIKRAHATPSLTLGTRRTIRRSAASLLTLGQGSKDRLVYVTTRRVPRALVAYFCAKGLRLVLNVATAARADTSPAAAVAESVTVVPTDDIARAQIAPRGVIAGTRSPTTIAAQEARPVIVRTIAREDTLSTMASYYDISLEALAFANGIGQEDENLAVGHELLIPPGEGALYKVKDGDTVED